MAKNMNGFPGGLLWGGAIEKVKSVTNEGILTQLTDHPFDQTIVDLENKAHEQFGLSKFNGTAKDYPKILMP